MNKIFFYIILSLAVIVCATQAEAKRSDLAGSWYTSSPSALKKEIETYLRKAEMSPLKGEVVGVIAPHAGLRYSGPVAAYAYKAVMEKDPEKVIVVGFSHRRHFPGRISVFTDKSFVTPLGEARIDTALAKKFIEYSDRIQDIPQAFTGENSIEMEIPFIQVALDDPRIVLIAIVDQEQSTVDLLSDALYNILKDEKGWVMIASTDMCHHIPYESANAKDARTIKVIEKFDPGYFYKKSLEEPRPDSLMCGYGAVYAVMDASKKLGADEVKVLKYANSGDTSGKKDSVVGYLSAAFIDRGDRKEEITVVLKEEGMYSDDQKKELLKIARDTIEEYLKTGKRLDVKTDDEMLKEDMGVFVTLYKDERLRGCIGHMVATGPLYLTVRDMAIASATEDPRFTPMKSGELDDVDIEISALSPMRKIDDPDEIELGKHGVMIRSGFRSGVYLPQVADETGWSKEQFMDSLCTGKAGIPADSWKTGKCDIYVFTAEVFGEKEL
ncbi:MAG: AmmeMemoRadiSam system protein B [Candidatus Tantalella remota]|nr:AmmeMemoRadiSam system protein B [Candidatus Tantalella remota]